MNNYIMMPIIISLKVSIISTIITSILSIFIAWMMVKFNKKNGSILEAIITLPLVLPPSILGYILLIVIGNNGLIGKFFYDNFGWSVIFTWKACVLASVIVSFGAIMMLAGNIPNKTQTIPLAMYYAVERGDKTTANTLMVVVVVFSFSLIYFLNRWIEKRRNRNAEV